MKYVILFVRNIVISAFVIYGYNIIAVNFNMIIPINLWTVGFVSIFNLPALLTLIFLKMWG